MDADIRAAIEALIDRCKAQRRYAICAVLCALLVCEEIGATGALALHIQPMMQLLKRQVGAAAAARRN